MTRRSIIFACIMAATALGFALQPARTTSIQAAGRGAGHHALPRHGRIDASPVHTLSTGSVWFQVDTPQTQIAGQPFSLTVTVRDSFNGVKTNYTGTVTLSDQFDPSATMPAPYQYTAADHGVHTFAGIQLTRAFVHDITISDNLNNSSYTTVPVVPGPVARVSVTTLPAIITGRSMTVFVTLWDALNNVAWNSTDLIRISNTDAQAVFPSSYAYVASDYGSRRAPIVFNTAGTQTITVKDTNRNVSGSATVQVDAAAAPSGFVVTDSGPDASNCTSHYTLACAINDANTAPADSPKTITFNISGCAGACVISPGTHSGSSGFAGIKSAYDAAALPVVTASFVTIDGTTQPGASVNTNALHSASGDNASIAIQIDGVGATGAGLELSGNGEIVQGLSVTNFASGAGIDLFDNTSTGAAGVRTHAASAEQAMGDTIQGNFIGVTPSNVAAGNQTGIAMLDGPALDTIGGSTRAARNVISNSSQAGIDEGSYCDPYPSSGPPCALIGHNTVQGSYVGTDATGQKAMPNDQIYGVNFTEYAGFQGQQVFDQVGGYTPETGNIFSGNDGYGFETGAYHTVQGNYVGTDSTGTSSVPNSQSIIASDNPSGAFGADAGGGFDFVGGQTLGARNLFSGNPQVQLEDSGGYNVVQGNLIGTNSGGTSTVPCMIPSPPTPCPIGPIPAGLDDSGGGGFIGGSAAGAGNVISGNPGYGFLSSGGFNLVQGNFIGTASTGTGANGNGYGSNGPYAGVWADGGGDSIGGIARGAGNVISNNTGPGILTDVATNYVLGNTIGFNSDTGVRSTGGEDMIGGPTAAARNIVGGNAGAGVEFDADLSFAQNDLIGYSSATTASGNHDGIAVLGAQGIQLLANTIANNSGAGVYVDVGTAPGGGSSTKGAGLAPSTSNGYALISQNSTFFNGGLGIDLAPRDVVNCSGPAPGPDNYAPCPVITNAAGSISGTAVAGSTVEVFTATNESDDQGHGEGQTYLGTAVADGSGNWKLSAPFKASVTSGQKLTATDTLPETSTRPAVTSEFSANVSYSPVTFTYSSFGSYTGGYCTDDSNKAQCTTLHGTSCPPNCKITEVGTGSAQLIGSSSVNLIEFAQYDSSGLSASITGGTLTLTSTAHAADKLVATIIGGSVSTDSSGVRHDVATFNFNPSQSSGRFAGATGTGSYANSRTCTSTCSTNSMTTHRFSMVLPNSSAPPPYNKVTISYSGG